MDTWFTALLTILASLVAAPVAPQAEQQRTVASPREQQWLYRDVLGSGDVEPTAIFLSYDYREVVFSAKCDRRTRELVLRSAIETGPNAPAMEPVEISSTSSTVRLRTNVVDGYLEGRTHVTDVLTSILRSDGDLEVFIPNEMGEPFYVGRAEPLRRLGLECLK